MADESTELFDDIYLGLRAGGAARKQRRGEPLSAEEEEAIGRWQRLSLWRRLIAIGAFALGMGGDEFNAYQFVIGVGAWLGTIMLFNVWVFIWPNQKKILGIVAATDDEKAKARKVALYASRTNFILSIPMLMCMGGQSHGLPF